MLKMHQKPFGGRALPGPAGELAYDTLAAIWGLRLWEGEGSEGERRGQARVPNDTFWLRY